MIQHALPNLMQQDYFQISMHLWDSQYSGSFVQASLAECLEDLGLEPQGLHATIECAGESGSTNATWPKFTIFALCEE